MLQGFQKPLELVETAAPIRVAATGRSCPEPSQRR
jgi:hypothetical protein